MRAMRWIFLGPPGSGKGTQAKKLAETYHLAHLSTGDILRREVSEGSQLGTQAKSFMDSGELVPDDLILGMIRKRLRNLGNGAGYVLDGFPRTQAQAEALDSILSDLGQSLDRVILFEVGPGEINKRLAGRAVEENRSDDSDKIVAHRIDVYHRQTEPLVDYYRRKGMLSRLNGERPVETVFSEIQQLAEDDCG
jgi:adenylate kinase